MREVREELKMDSLLGHAIERVATARASGLTSIWAVVNGRSHRCEGRADGNATKVVISEDTTREGQESGGRRHLEERAERDGHCRISSVVLCVARGGCWV